MDEAVPGRFGGRPVSVYGCNLRTMTQPEVNDQKLPAVNTGYESVGSTVADGTSQEAQFVLESVQPNLGPPAEPGLLVPGILVSESTSGAPQSSARVEAGKDRFAWLLTSFAFLLLLSYFLPYTVERMTYAIARGRELARYETAGEMLNNVALKDLSDAYQLVANRVGPSVVHIMVASASTDAASQLPGASRWQHPSTSQGSGVIVDEEGFVVTNAHVIDGYSRIRVKLSDGRTVAASVVGIDRLTDMAVLKVAADRLVAAQWGDSDELEVGALVWALGSPLGLQHSVTFGILSGKNRTFSTEDRSGILNSQGISGDSPYHNFLQTDAAVNPGNSGGPLVDAQGRIVGINTAIVGEAYQGISFSIPSSVARPIYERIRNEGHVTRGWLGVDPQDVSPELAQRLGLPSTDGALVMRVVPNLDNETSPAQLAGIAAGDVIVRWDNKPVKNRNDLFSLVALTRVGTAVEIVVIRDGAEKTLTVTVTQRPVSSG